MVFIAHVIIVRPPLSMVVNSLCTVNKHLTDATRHATAIAAAALPIAVPPQAAAFIALPPAFLTNYALLRKHAPFRALCRVVEVAFLEVVAEAVVVHNFETIV